MKPICFVILACMMATVVLAQAVDKPATSGSRGEVKLTPEAIALHRDAIVIDGHNDLPYQFGTKANGSWSNLNIAKSQPQLHTDIPRLKQGGVGAQFWSAYVEADKLKGPAAVKATLVQIDTIQQMVRAYPETFAMAATADDIIRIRKQGKVASMIGVEGGHSIDNSLEVLRMFYDLGVRYMTLTHTSNTDWADSCTDEPKHNGLSPFGEQVVREMNRLGMFVDISHVSADTMKHATRVSKAPVIASHSSAFAICAVPRNVPDDVLLLIKQNGGVVMVNFFPGFIAPEAGRIGRNMFQAIREIKAKYPKDEDRRLAWEQWKKENPLPKTSIHAVVDHIDHIVKIAGIDHVGLGSDFDGITVVPKQLEDVSCYPYLTQELLNRGYKKEDILKILGGNLLRAMREMERVTGKN